ncbi:MAG: DUF6597 domain-containing transcriptional factor [Deferribacterales bacterium]
MKPVYYEIKPSPLLEKHIKCFWVMRGTFLSISSYRIFPDCCADIIFSLLAPGDIHLAEPDTGYYDISLTGAVHVCGVRFLPGGMQALSGTDAPADLPDSKFIKLIRNSVRDRVFFTEEDYFGHISRLLLPLCGKSPDPVMSYWLNSRDCSVSDIKRYFGVSQKTVTRKMSSLSGLNPSLLNRVRRFQRALSLMRTSVCLTDVAHEAGYFDQPHFIRDFREFSGVRPSDFAGLMNSMNVRFIQFPAGVI